jgi:hypothetical protein
MNVAQRGVLRFRMSRDVAMDYARGTRGEVRSAWVLVAREATRKIVAWKRLCNARGVQP